MFPHSKFESQNNLTIEEMDKSFILSQKWPLFEFTVYMWSFELTNSNIIWHSSRLKKLLMFGLNWNYLNNSVCQKIYTNIGSSGFLYN